ncbi:hypothetical protein BofuT4_P065080.1 [Botrytis cinerea T4]|uniref:Uncharacterized protein n=1 Tax=Botryotinia fuckeliana (strain T4) TaxID=999810 RepID=G2XSM9_BOTF4|nr:hypothetical protein BofuT4_P065080.1 [Botrytis cinerea T4]
MATKEIGEAGANIRLDDGDPKTHLPHVAPLLSRRSSSSSSSTTSYNMAHTPISVIQEAGSDLFEERSHVEYLKPFEEEILKMRWRLINYKGETRVGGEEASTVHYYTSGDYHGNLQVS